MRWLTRDWHGSGEKPLDDQEVAERNAAYRAHVRSILPRLPEPLKAFVGEPVGGRVLSLHDGRVEDWDANLPDRLMLKVICGDLQRGFERLTIEYRMAVELLGAEMSELASWLGDEQTELLYDEVDALADGRFEHRHLLWPDGEFGVRFLEIAVDTSPATPEGYEHARRPRF